jgi:CubicO group peptidase (beta-lactamase class C family)
MIARAHLAALLFVLPALRLPAQAGSAYARVDSVVAKELGRTHTPGGAVALVSGDRVVYARGFGTRSADGADPVTPGTRFNIASVTKIFTASTLATLAQEGRIDLAAPIGARLGELPESLRTITAHQLLSHTAGLVMAPVAVSGSVPDSALAEVVRQVSPRAMVAPRGEIFSYSNLGYQLAGRMIELVGGRSYAAQVRQVLFDPLALRATSFSSGPPPGDDVAIGSTDPTARPAAAVGAESWPFAGIYSNVSDLARFAIAFMNDGRIDGRQVLSREVIARVSAPAARFHSGEGDYGYGVRVYRHRGVDVVEHGGVSPDGYRSLLFMVPSRRVAVIVLANRAGRRPYAVADAALDALLPGVLEPIAPMPGPVAMDSTEMARYVGRYASGIVVNVTVDDGALTLHQGPLALPIRKLADGRFVAGSEETAGGWVAFVSGPDGAVQYLHYSMRAFRRL